MKKKVVVNEKEPVNSFSVGILAGDAVSVLPLLRFFRIIEVLLLP